MTRIEFFFDPCCPFSWITSRWLLQVNKEREIEVNWRQFSLAMKNGELGNDAGPDDADWHRKAHRIHRVIAASVAQGAHTIDLYTAFGRARHVDDRDFDDALIAEVLSDLGLDADLASAADDTSLDAGLEDELAAAIDAAGEQIGVPLIVFTTADGQRRGYFGPVLNALPSRENGLAIWDAVSGLGPVTEFYELKRTRHGAPDTASTKGA